MRPRQRWALAVATAALAVVFALPALGGEPDLRALEQAERHNRFGAQALKVGNVGKAERHYQKALSLFPEFPEALEGMGHVLMAERRFEDALSRYRDALAAYESMGGAILDIQQARYNQAQQEIVRLRDAIQELRLLAARAGNRRNPYERRIVEMENRLALLEGMEQPTADRSHEAPGELHFHIGNALYRLGRTAEAIEEWQVCIRKAPRFPTVYNNLAVVSWQQGRIEDARFYLARAEELEFPVNPDFKAELTARQAAR